MILPPVYESLEPGLDMGSLGSKNLYAREIAQRVTSKVQPESIILFYNAALHTRRLCQASSRPC